MKKVLLYICFIFIYFILITGSTYAYLVINSSNNSIAGDGGCFEINYTKGQDINAENLSATTNYKEGAQTSITISKKSNCQIYNYASIYIHTNDSATAPIESTKALRYKITKSNGEWEYNGFVQEKGDYLLANIPLTTTSTEYQIYLWVDSNLSNGTYSNKTFSGYIYATSNQSSTIEVQDTIQPALFVKKETYIEGFNNWTFNNAEVKDGELILAKTGTSGSATSPYYNVNGENWNYSYEAYTTTPSSRFTPKGGLGTSTSYYDDDLKAIVSDTGYSTNGHAGAIPINSWNSLNWRLGSWSAATIDNKIKNIKIILSTGSEWSQPVTKVRNFKVHGQFQSSFYDIFIEAKDDRNIALIKQASGEQEETYFQSNGTTVTNNQFRVAENGYYTIYVKDNTGNATISTIYIDKIS